MAVRKKNPDGIEFRPLDVQSLEKGDYISPEFLIEECNFKCRDKSLSAYGLELLTFTAELKKHLRRISRRWVLRQERGGIRLCSDESAVGITENRLECKLKQFSSSLKDTISIDAGNLTDETKKKWSSNVVKYGKTMQAIRVSRRLELPPAKRTTPGIPKKPPQ